MTPIRKPHRAGRAVAAAAVAGAALLAGCASTRLDAQWSDPQLPANMLRGARIVVACEAHDLVVKRICQDLLAAEVAARGATPVVGPDTGSPASGRPLGDEPYLTAARGAGARALWTHHVAPAAAGVSPGVSVGLGVFGIGGGGVHGGVGVSAPIGGGRTSIGYVLDSRVTDARSGRLLWTARASAPPSSDVRLQLDELTKAVFGAADKAQLF
jgi:hypothetical protein